MFGSGSVLGIRIRIHKAPEYGSGSTTLVNTLFSQERLFSPGTLDNIVESVSDLQVGGARSSGRADYAPAGGGRPGAQQAAGGRVGQPRQHMAGPGTTTCLATIHPQLELENGVRGIMSLTSRKREHINESGLGTGSVFRF